MRLNIFLLFMAFLFECPDLFGQLSEQDHYKILLNEAQLYIRIENTNSSYSTLIDSALAHAHSSNYDLAIVYLEEFIALAGQESPSTMPAYPQLEPAFPSYNLSIKTGVDFNRQEFEFGYIDSDSILLDQVNKPFVGLQADFNIWENETQKLSCTAFSRYDKENWTNTADLSFSVRQSDWNMQLMGGTIIDKNDLYPDLAFSDIHAHQILNIEGYQYLRYFLDNLLRWKRYNAPSQVVPDYLRNSLRTGFRFVHPYWGNAEFSYQFDWNESIDYKNNDFAVNEFLGSYNQYWALAYLSGDLGFRRNDYAFLVADSINENISSTVYSRLQFTVPVFPRIDFLAGFNSRSKHYRDKTEIEPDYFHYDFNTSIRYVQGALSLEGGYRHEAREHKLIAGVEPSYILEQNYKSDGIMLNMDLSMQEYLSLSASGIYSLRRYPDSKGADAFGIYNNQNIFSLFLIGSWNINKKIAVNLFISYDNDDDLDIEYNTTRSSYYSLELEYKM